MRILLDVDGPIADFVGGVLDELKRLTGRDCKHHVVTQYNIKKALGITDYIWKQIIEHIKSSGFARNLKAHAGAVDAVKALAKDHDVYFVTAPWQSSPTWVYDRTEWLVDRFGRTQGRKIVPTEHKHLIDGDFLIDDKPEQVAEWSNAHPGRVGVLWSMPHNHGAGWRLRTNDWDELRRIIDAP